MIVQLPEPELRRWLEIKPKLDLSRLPTDYLEKIMIFAVKVRKIGSLLDGLERIGTLAHNTDLKGRLFTDFAPQSLTFDAGGFSGGLIFHSAHDGGGDGGMPTLSVCLRPVDGWSLHT
jgi:hypothetical protein